MYWLSAFKDMTLPRTHMLVDDLVQVSPNKICFTISTSRPAMFVVFEVLIEGSFHPNNLQLLSPCTPVQVCFESQVAVTAYDLSWMMEVSSLAHYQGVETPPVRVITR